MFTISNPQVGYVTCSSIELVDYRAGLRGYAQFNKYTHTHTHIRFQASLTITVISNNWGMLRRSRRVQIFLEITAVNERYVTDLI